MFKLHQRWLGGRGRLCVYNGRANIQAVEFILRKGGVSLSCLLPSNVCVVERSDRESQESRKRNFRRCIHTCLKLIVGLVMVGAMTVAWPGVVVAAAKTDAMILAQDGKPKVTVIVSGDEAPANRLRDYLRRITGAKFEQRTHQANTARQKNAIYVGVIKSFDWLKVSDVAELGREGFVIKTDGDCVYLVAASQAGVEHAVTTFLHRLGCRWYFPGETWEVIPQLSAIKGVWNERQSPAFKTQRRIWYGYGAYGDGKKAWQAWMRDNRMGGPIDVSIGHTWHGLNAQKQFESHPDWFALVDGKRQPTKPCYSHPDVVKTAIASAMKQAERGSAMISMTPPDGLGYCECEKCRAVFQGAKPFESHGSLFARRPDGTLVNITSETVFALVNQVAAAVAKKHPSTLIGCYAYSAYSHPPSFDLHPNVYLQTTTAYRRTPIELSDQLQAFGKKTKQLGIREYYSVYQWDWDFPSPGKLTLDQLQKDLRFFSKNGVTAVNAEASNNWAPRGFGYYIASQLMWDTDADVKALVRNFYLQAFGPAALPTQRYYVRWYGQSAAVLDDDQALPTVQTYRDKNKLNIDVLKAAYLDLDEAARLVKDKPLHLARVNHLRMYMHYMLLRYRLEQASASNDNELILTAIRDETIFGARLTSTHMIHTRPLLGKAFLRRFKKFEPMLKDVSDANRSNAGWRKVSMPPTQDEFDKLWMQDKAFLKLK